MHSIQLSKKVLEKSGPEQGPVEQFLRCLTNIKSSRDLTAFLFST